MTKQEEIIVMLLENQNNMKKIVERLTNLVELLTLEVVSIKNNLEIDRMMNK